MNRIMEALKYNPGLENMQISNESVLSFPGLEIHPDRRKVYCGHQEIFLTAKEYNLLCLLAENKGRVLTYDQIYQRIWGDKPLGNESNTIACHIHNLRKKIIAVLPEPPFSIRCIREIGYCFETEEI